MFPFLDDETEAQRDILFKVRVRGRWTQGAERCRSHASAQLKASSLRDSDKMLGACLGRESLSSWSFGHLSSWGWGALL